MRLITEARGFNMYTMLDARHILGGGNYIIDHGYPRRGLKRPGLGLPREMAYDSWSHWGTVKRVAWRRSQTTYNWNAR